MINVQILTRSLHIQTDTPFHGGLLLTTVHSIPAKRVHAGLFQDASERKSVPLQGVRGHAHHREENKKFRTFLRGLVLDTDGTTERQRRGEELSQDWLQGDRKRNG